MNKIDEDIKTEEANFCIWDIFYGRSRTDEDKTHVLSNCGINTYLQYNSIDFFKTFNYCPECGKKICVVWDNRS